VHVLPPPSPDAMADNLAGAGYNAAGAQHLRRWRGKELMNLGAGGRLWVRGLAGVRSPELGKVDGFRGSHGDDRPTVSGGWRRAMRQGIAKRGRPPVAVGGGRRAPDAPYL
jgi:hypothetical protein